MHIPILTVLQNARIICRQNSLILQQNVAFEAFFRGEGYSNANYLFYILTFQFLIRGILMHVIIVIIAYLVAKNMVIFC